MSDNLQQLAEQLLDDLAFGESISYRKFVRDKILSALQSAARQGQREALLAAADEMERLDRSTWERFIIKRADRRYCGWDWLRARASALEGEPTAKP